MRRREAFLWLLFFIGCFGAGYYHRILPETRPYFFWSDPESVKILVFSDKLFPAFLLKDLEKKTHSKIQLEISKSYSDFLAQSVSASQYALFLLPRLWSQSLNKQGLLLPLSGLKSYFQKTMHPDFPIINDRLFPWAWIPTIFIMKSNSDTKTLKSIHIVDDDDHIFQILKLLPPEKKSLELHRITLLEEAEEISDFQVKEVNYFNRNNYGQVQTPPHWPQTLFIFDLVIPQKTPRRVTSIVLLKEVFNRRSLLRDFATQNFGGTSLDFEAAFYPDEKKPSALRDQTLQRLLQPQSSDPDEREKFFREKFFRDKLVTEKSVIEKHSGSK